MSQTTVDLAHDQTSQAWLPRPLETLIGLRVRIHARRGRSHLSDHQPQVSGSLARMSQGRVT